MARPPSRKRRNIRYPEGETKTDLLLYLAEGKKGRGEIISHLRKKKKIKTARLVDKHLKQLREDGLLVQDETEKGKTTYYQLNKEYFGIKKVISYISENNRTIEIMDTDYFDKSLNDDLFIGVTKDILKILLFQMMFLSSAEFEKLKENPKFSRFTKELERNKEALESFQKIRKAKEDDWEKISEELKDEEISIEWDDELEQSLDMMIDMITKALPYPLFDLVSKFIFPLKERIDFIGILKSSPSALNSIFNIIEFEMGNSTMLLDSYIRFYHENMMNYSNQFKDTGNKEEMKEMIIQDCEDFVNRCDKKAKSPLYLMVRSLLISDIFNSNINYNKWFNEYYSTLFVDDESLRQLIKDEIKKLPEGSD